MPSALFRTLTLAALAACVLAAPAAMAERHSAGKPSMSVFHGDLDLSSPAGGETLLKRIAQAASRVCGGKGVHQPIELDRFATCRRTTVADTVRQLGIGSLTLAWSAAQPPKAVASR